MTITEIKTKLREILENVLDEDILATDFMADSTNLRAWDSLSLVNIFVQTEKAFKIKLPLGKLATLNTMADLLAVIQENQSA
ncbi:acyl carrier protein [Candidatus Termititenax persephonae]|uniref:Acyl carrier protein n=1 Tax=Candidatus Termititenax persephonae TaxID=2218525 RepID=A0A388THZ6_9BACT|nr:acyl carrier protein [Candidatus Termititenax persephonae]